MPRNNPSEWMVSATQASYRKKPIYQVYRLRDKDGVDHEGNREYQGGDFKSRQSAEDFAFMLNTIGADKEDDDGGV